MQSLIPSPSSDDRPQGVAAISGLLALVGIAALIVASLVSVHLVPLSCGSVLLQGGMEQSGPIAFLIYAALTLTLAWVLWTKRRWARRLTILLAGIGVAFAVPAISSAVADGRPLAIVREGLQIMVRVAVIYYLSQEPVREWFSSRRQ